MSLNRFAKRRDDNERAIVLSLRRLGYSVEYLDVIDLAVGKDGINGFFEVKDPAKVPSQKKLTKNEQKFFDTWKGQVNKVESLEEILSIMSALRANCT